MRVDGTRNEYDATSPRVLNTLDRPEERERASSRSAGARCGVKSVNVFQGEAAKAVHTEALVLPFSRISYSIYVLECVLLCVSLRRGEQRCRASSGCARRA